MSTIKLINPSTEEMIVSYDEMSFDIVDDIIKSTLVAQKQWKITTFDKRTNILKNAAELLSKNKQRYAKLITETMGKPITAAIAEIEKCQWVCEYYADYAKQYLSEQIIDTNFTKSSVSYHPLGVIFAIMPWNYPFWQVFRFAAPNLMGGNGVVLSHAPISTSIAFEIEALLQEAGFPDNLFKTVVVSNEAAEKIIQHDGIAGVTLTGSERAGRSVAATAGAALKKVVLELGGSDPYVVLSDANIEVAAEAIVTSRMNNSGQVCIAAKRIIAEHSIHDQLLKQIMHRLQEYKMGDPLNADIKLGPLARFDLRNTVHQQVQKSIEQGATLICGGELPRQKGFYYPPTVLTNVEPGMLAFDEEIFGPVISMVKSKTDDHAIHLANQTRYGLSAVVFTKDLKKGEQLAKEHIEAGTCNVNAMVSSDPRLPFGGIKSSGFGRELAVSGIHEFMNIKTVCIA